MTIDDDDDNDRNLNPILIPPAQTRGHQLFVTSPLNPRTKERSDSSEAILDQKKTSFNDLMIPQPRLLKLREILDKIKIPQSFRKKKKERNKFVPTTDRPFDVLTTSKMKPLKEQRGGSATKTGKASQSQDIETTPEALLSAQKENYQKIYWKKKAESKKIQEKEANEESEKKRLEKETPEEMALRGRAISLRDEMNGWKAKVGTGEYDDSTIQANIDQLERNFYGIDFKYRP